MSESFQETRQGSARPRKARTGLGLRVLVVEDDEQVAAVLAALLESEGYDVTVAGTAETGLSRLREGAWHLLISDYWLPDKTGAWMLKEAHHNGWMKGCQVLVVTAEHRPQGVENLRVLRKPLDLDDFLHVVHEALADVRRDETDRTRTEVERTHQRTGGDGRPRLELTLYISAASRSSLRALRNLRQLLEGYDTDQVHLGVVDLSRERSPLAEEDRIAFTPTLVKRSPEPKVWILGDLDDTDLVRDLLSQAGVERTR